MSAGSAEFWMCLARRIAAQFAESPRSQMPEQGSRWLAGLSVGPAARVRALVPECAVIGYRNLLRPLSSRIGAVGCPRVLWPAIRSE